MKQLQLIGLSLSELTKSIKEEIVPQITKELMLKLNPQDEEKYFTRKEICELFDIDLSTLHHWRKKGILKAYGIGNRVYFKKQK